MLQKHGKMHGAIITLNPYLKIAKDIFNGFIIFQHGFAHMSVLCIVITIIYSFPFLYE